MTQEELQVEIAFILAEHIAVILSPKRKSSSAPMQKKMLKLINRHVKDVLGEDESNELFEDGRDAFAHLGAEKLRAEQRKRAGL